MQGVSSKRCLRIMSHYYADFRQAGSDWFRLDTRVYLRAASYMQSQGTCIGAVAAKNPGSATGTSGWGSLCIGNDQMLPNVLRIFIKAYHDPIYQGRADKRGQPEDAYVQILNLFHLCDPVLKSALQKIAACKAPLACKTAGGPFPLVWYAWGGPCSRLQPFRNRFVTAAKHSFFFDPRQNARGIKCWVPASRDFAKHPQGLAHRNIVPHLARRLP